MVTYNVHTVIYNLGITHLPSYSSILYYITWPHSPEVIITVGIYIQPMLAQTLVYQRAGHNQCVALMQQ